MKKLIAILIVGFLAGCEGNGDRARTIHFPAMPDELADCKVYSISNSDGVYIKVMRCPNSTTSTNYSDGKISKSTVVIDGETYEKKE